MHEHYPKTGSPSKSHKRRWRLAFTAICFTRALSTKILLENQETLLRSVSYVAVDIHTFTAPANDQYDHISFLDVDPIALSEIVRAKNLESLSQYGGVKKVVEALKTDAKGGLSCSTEANLGHRRNIFGANVYQKQPAKGFLYFLFEAFKDTVLIILLGIKQYGWKDGWFDGGSIIFVVFLVLAFSALSSFNKSRQLIQKLSTKGSDIRVEVIRNGRHHIISTFEIVVGDVVCLKIGDQIPADGLFLEGYSLKVDESSMTGESDHVEINGARNPFLLSSTKVTDGFGTMLVTSVGMNTAWGEMMSSVSRDLDEETPLQARLKKMTSFNGKVGLSVAALVLVVLMIRYFTGHTTSIDEKGLNGSKTKFDDVMNAVLGIVSVAVTILVVAIPEGLPLAVTLTLAYSMKRMMKDNAMVRKFSACEMIGSPTTICTDKTGTLTLNEMKVTEVWFGKETLCFGGVSEMSPTIINLLRESIGLNTAGSVYKASPESAPEISGSPTEKAILSWAVFNLGLDIDEVKTQSEIIQVVVFNSEKKRSGVLIRKNYDKTLQTHWKGAPETVLSMCSNYYDKDGIIRAMNDEERIRVEAVIQSMAAKSLRCIAFAHKKREEEKGQVHEKLEESGLTLLGLAGLKNPCQPGVRTAIETCIAAGVGLKMITGDNVHTARAIAIECGILNPEEDLESGLAVVEGVQFRNYSPEERKKKVDSIRVMARSSPLDKRLMVECLKQKGHVVAVIGDGTNDAPALKEADIGLSMGIQGTEVAKESSDIVILDDNFTSVVTVVRWGRCVYNNIQKFIQFQLTMNIAAFIINFVASVCSGKVPLTAVQLLWVNLKMDTLAALALATEQPTNELMKTPSIGRSDQPLITRVMWRNLIAHALFQVIVLLTLEFKGKSIFGVDEKVKDTLIFNTFVLCQVFNEFNARKLVKKNIFEGIHKNKLFLAIIGITILLQLVIVEFLNKFASTERLNWGQWGASIGIATLSWPIDWLVKCIPVNIGKQTQLERDLLAKEL